MGTRIVDNKGQEFSFNYRLHSSNGDWKVYEVNIEDISLVNNYRAQFSRVGAFVDLSLGISGPIAGVIVFALGYPIFPVRCCCGWLQHGVTHEVLFENAPSDATSRTRLIAKVGVTFWWMVSGSTNRYLQHLDYQSNK